MILLTQYVNCLYYCTLIYNNYFHGLTQQRNSWNWLNCVLSVAVVKRRSVSYWLVSHICVLFLAVVRQRSVSCWLVSHNCVLFLAVVRWRSVSCWLVSHNCVLFVAVVRRRSVSYWPVSRAVTYIPSTVTSTRRVPTSWGDWDLVDLLRRR